MNGVDHCGQLLTGRRHVHTDHGGPVPVQGAGDGLTDAAGGAGHHGDLACQRPVPVLRQRTLGGPDRQELSGDEGAAGREQEAQGTDGAGCGHLSSSGEDQSVGGAATTHLMGQRTGQSFDPLACRTCRRIRGVGGIRGDGDHARRGPQLPHHLSDLQCRVREVSRGLDRVEAGHHGGEAVLGSGMPADIHSPVQQLVGHLLGGGTAAQDQCQTIQEGLARCMPTQLDRLWEPEGCGDLLAQGLVHQGGVGVSAHGVSLLWVRCSSGGGSVPDLGLSGHAGWPRCRVRRRRRRRSGPGIRRPSHAASWPTRPRCGHRWRRRGDRRPVTSR